MKKTLFAIAALFAGMSASAQPEGITAHAPVVPWGAQAELIITSDLTHQDAEGKWRLTEDAQKWVVYERDGVFESNNEVQQTNRANVWYDIYSETGKYYPSEKGVEGAEQDGEGNWIRWTGCDDMILTNGTTMAWGGYLTVTNKAGSTSGLIVVGKARFPHFYVTGTDKAKFYFSGSAGTKGYPQIEVYEAGSETPVIVKTGDFALTKSTWDHSTLLIADGLDKAKSYEIVCRTMALNGEEYTYEGGDIVLQVVKLYGDVAPMRKDGLIISGSEIGSYINAHLAAYPEETDFTLEGSGKYTITDGITAFGKFTLTGDASAPATIDASALAAPFVQFATIAEEAEKDENGFVAATNVKFANIKVNALGQPLFSSNNQNYLIPELTIDNSVIALSGNPFVIDFRNGGLVAKVSVNKSTIWAAEATGNSFYTGQSGKKATEAGLEEQIFSFTNCTLSNIAAGKNFFTHRQTGQTWLTFEVKNNIIANCGKDNFLASLNGGQTSSYPKYTVEGITVLKTTTEGDGEEAVSELTNINELQATSDETEEIVNPIDGVPFTLANALAGNFKLTASSQQAKYKTGDPRWMTPYATDAIKIEVDMSENTDFVAALNAALEQSEQPSSIEISFWEAGEYPTTGEINTTAPIRFLSGSDINAGDATIVVNNGMTLGGSIEFNGVNLKAGEGFAAPFITLAGNDYKMQANEFYNMGAIKFLNMSIKSGTQQILYGNKVKNQISELLVENCIVDVDGCTKVPFDFNGGGAIGAFNIKKSTIWAANATGQSLFSTQSGNKATDAGYTTQNFAIDNSMLYNIAKDKNFYTHRQNSQNWESYYLRNSIIVDCGKKGQFIKGMNGGGSSVNPNWVVSGNAIFFTVDGVLTDQSANESTGDDDQPAQNAIAGSIKFDDLANGDFDAAFTLAEDVEEPTNLGDPRWTIEYVAPEVSSPYYLVGNFTEWTVNDTYNLQRNEEAGEGIEEYMITLNLAADAQFKVVKSEDGISIADGGWYPGGTDNNYGENGELTQGEGSYTVYFRPNGDGNEDWFYNVIYVAYNGPATGINAIAADNMKNATYYNLQGVRVAQPTKGLYIVNGKKVVIK